MLNEDPGVAKIECLANEMGASLTCTARRLVELTSRPVVLASSVNGIVEWPVASNKARNFRPNRGALILTFDIIDSILLSVAQLLVRNVDESLVRKLKNRAKSRGVSAEEEHRQILKQVLSRPVKVRPSLIEFLVSKDGEAHPDVELDLRRSREVEVRDMGF